MKRTTSFWLTAAIVLPLSVIAGVFLYKSVTSDGIIDDKTEADRRANVVKALPVNIDVNNLEDGIYPVSFNREDIRLKDGVCTIVFEIFNMDLYDAVELHQLKPGDYIEIKGETVRIDSLSLEGSVLINGGLENGGVELIPVGGGVYRCNGWSDIATYTSFGKVELAVPENIDFIDKGNVSESMEGVVVPGKGIYEYLKTTDFGVFNEHSVKIRTENGKVVEFWRIYTP